MKKYVVLFCMIMAVTAMAFAAGGKDSAKKTDEWVRSVDVVVPAKAGGGTDLMARAQFTQVAKDAGINYGVINNETGNAVVAMEDVRNARTDGSKLLFFNGGFLTRIASGIYNHTLDDFTVIGVAHGPEPAYALLVASDSGINTIQDLIARAKAKELLFGCNVGGTTQIMGANLAESLGVEFKYVASGADTATLTELVGHSIDLCYANINQARQYVESGRAIALGILPQVANGGRSTLMPDVPVMSELGYKLNFNVLTIVLGPKGMDEGLAKKIHGYLASAASHPDVLAITKPAGFDVVYYNYDEGFNVLKSEQDNYVNTFKKYGMRK